MSRLSWIKENFPTVETVLSSLNKEEIENLKGYAKRKSFHQGNNYFSHGANTSCVMAAAFELTPSKDENSWYGAEMNDKTFAALAHLTKYAGGPKGIERFVKEVDCIDASDLNELVNSL